MTLGGAAATSNAPQLSNAQDPPGILVLLKVAFTKSAKPLKVTEEKSTERLNIACRKLERL